MNDTKNKIDRLEKISNRNNEYIQKLLDKEPNSKMNVFDELKRIVLRNHDTNNEEIIGRLRKIYRDIPDEKNRKFLRKLRHMVMISWISKWILLIKWMRSKTA